MSSVVKAVYSVYREQNVIKRKQFYQYLILATLQYTYFLTLSILSDVMCLKSYALQP